MDTKFDYLKESERTLSDKFYGSEVKEIHARQLMVNFSNAASNIDRLKKGLFYGRDLETLPKGMFNLDDHEKNKDILHAIIGIASEAGELVDAYLKTWSDYKPQPEIDIVNLCEEVGDILWYAAIICREAGVSLEDIQRNNIEKLAKRFPDKFTEFNANNRDLSAEREILEKMVLHDEPNIDDAILVQYHGRAERVVLDSIFENSLKKVTEANKEMLGIISDSVKLPNSIEPEVGCISKAKLAEALEHALVTDLQYRFNDTEKFVDWIFKNYA
ncbi:nucleotide pyrophosphohydrolase [Erwinia phage AH03]|uniref:Nucleotide pyrophosphohydrolase n=1 Tax=Erwinia phage AH03 TaxID=2869568 RepID=A0AAE7X0C0_9CAUD|nr:nucleotide pyrophosphohydrolase [Erwinia phage AH03]